MRLETEHQVSFSENQDVIEGCNSANMASFWTKNSVKRWPVYMFRMGFHLS